MIWNIAATLLLLLNQVQGHGYMTEPRSRNYRARQEGSEPSSDGNRPLVEYDADGLNNLGHAINQCGIVQETKEPWRRNYDRPLASNDAPLPWQSQANYQQGSVITIRLHLTASHSLPHPRPGIFEFYACPRNQPLTEACFKQNILPVVEGTPEVIHGSSWVQDREFRVQLPRDLTGDVLIQWVWINNNSWVGETFRNCAEVTISGGNGNTGGNNGGGTCGNGNQGNGVCANGECCSQWGWCGTSSAHCSGGGTVTKLGDWALCSSSSQCSNGCCSGKYSGGDLKCTPLGQNFDFWANGCVSRRRLRGNETLVNN